MSAPSNGPPEAGAAATGPTGRPMGRPTARPTTGAAVVAEADRVMTICNACRYCEGHCAVFPAMERRLSFNAADLGYLANLCHNCGSCYHHCQYAPPHAFAVNVPQAFADLRHQTYRAYAWPGFLAGLFDRNGLMTGLVAAASLALVMVLTVALVDADRLFAVHTGPGAFYAVIPHAVMAWSFGAVGLFVLLAFVMGFRNFWRHTSPTAAGTTAGTDTGHLARALHDVLTLRNLKGGGDGCTFPTETPSHGRRIAHHLTFYGFLLCFAATAVATLFHSLLGWEAPYAWYSPPVLLGTIGGIGLLLGPIGLLRLKLTARAAGGALVDDARFGMDFAFITLLFLTSLTGLLLLLLRATPAMGLLLAIHLGVVLGLFLTMPYGKFVHGLYRFAALVRNAAETRAAAR